MDRERWQRVDRILDAALERGISDRADFIARECGGDESLRAEVESLLSAFEEQDGFLERPALRDGLELLANDDERLLIGETVGNYRVVRRLGRGGVGDVYLAEDARLRRPAALKLLRRDRADNGDDVQRFRREAVAASALNHPNILTIYEIGEWHGRDFIAAEFVDGKTLRERIQDGDLPLGDCVEVAAQIAGALAAAHHAGIVHRDIKPENIMVRADGLVKVLDFGIANLMEWQGAADSEDWSETATGVVIGTAAYMSPEQACGGDVDERTDIWSLGVVLYEMIAGRIPFSGATPADCLAAVLDRVPERMQKFRRDIPAALEAIVASAIAKSRDARYTDAATLAEDLRKLRAEIDSPEVSPAAGSLTTRRRSRTRIRAATVAFISFIAIGSAAGLFYRAYSARHSRETSRGIPAEAIHSLAVLPLNNAGGSPDTEYLSDGITESLINDLSDIPGLKVMSRSAVFRYKNLKIDPQQVGHSLRVRAVLSGSVLRHAGNLLVTVEVVDTRDNSHIWGERYDRKFTEILDVQQEIASEITDGLRLRLSGQEKQRLARRHTRDNTAYELYLKGQYYWLRRAFPSWRSGSAPDFDKSRDYFQQAIEADPGYALAYSGLGHYYARAAGDGLMAPEEGWPKAEAAFRKALGIDPNLPEAHAGLGVIHWMAHRDWVGAEQELQRAIQVNSNRPDTLYGRLLAAEGRFDDAAAQVQGALELDPLSVRYSSALGRILYYARRYDESARQYRHALELDPNDPTVHEDLADVLETRGLGEEAVAEWRAALILNGEAASAEVLRRSYAAGGLSAATGALARTKLERFGALRKRGVLVPAVEYARAYLRLGQKEQALRWLSTACDERTAFVLSINVDPFYDELRGDPRFQELVERIRVPN